MHAGGAVPETVQPADVLGIQRTAYRAEPYPALKVRRERLRRLERAILERQDQLAAALNSDFGGRCRQEVWFSEVLAAIREVRHARSHVGAWMEKRPRSLDWSLQPARAWVMPQPLGVIGVIAPWNYPIFLTIGPLAGALAAGNRVMIKVSEYTPATSDAIAALVAGIFPADLAAVVTGGPEVGRAFSSLPFDHLLFTGSTAVGREVMRAAAENLTPVTLELGGKSPAIVAPDADLDSAAADIAYGRFLNAGQTCIAPDYALVPAGREEEFAEAIRRQVERYWPDPARNPEYTAVINDRQAARLRGYIEEAQAAGARVIAIGPAPEPGSRRMPPTLIVNPPDGLRVMREEIFGPILPVKTYTTMEDAIAYVNDHDRPLALYLFTKSGRTTKEVLERTISGAACVNDTLMYIAAGNLPFGGVGASGTGHYHGRDGFDTFSKLKPVFRRRWPGLARSLRPPYGRLHDVMKRILIG